MTDTPISRPVFAIVLATDLSIAFLALMGMAGVFG